MRLIPLRELVIVFLIAIVIFDPRTLWGFRRGPLWRRPPGRSE